MSTKRTPGISLVQHNLGAVYLWHGRIGRRYTQRREIKTSLYCAIPCARQLQTRQMRKNDTLKMPIWRSLWRSTWQLHLYDCTRSEIKISELHHMRSYSPAHRLLLVKHRRKSTGCSSAGRMADHDDGEGPTLGRSLVEKNAHFMVKQLASCQLFATRLLCVNLMEEWLS